MPNVPELEQRWMKHQYKKFLPFVISFFILIIMIILIAIYYSNDTKTVSSKKNIKVKPTIAKPIKIKKKQIVKIIKQKKTIISTQLLQPSMNFMNQIGNSIIPPYQKHKAIAKIKQTPLHIRKMRKIVKRLKVQKKVQIISTKSFNQITITTKPISKNMQNIVKRFKQSNDPILSLFLAKRYYQMKKYNLAYNYSLITNQLDNNNNTSWIIFVKSLVKLGQKNMAIKTLKAYIKHSKSQTAKTLLNNIESGRFK